MSCMVHTFHLLGDFLNSTDGCAIQVFLVAASLNEEVGLDVLFHLLHTGHKVVVPPIFLSVAWLTCGVWKREREREGGWKGRREGEEGGGEGEGREGRERGICTMYTVQGVLNTISLTGNAASKFVGELLY